MRTMRTWTHNSNIHFRWKMQFFTELGQILYRVRAEFFSQNSILLNIKWTDTNGIFKCQVDCLHFYADILWQFLFQSLERKKKWNERQNILLKSHGLMIRFEKKESNPSTHNHISFNFIEYFPFAMQSHNTLSSVSASSFRMLNRNKLYKLRFRRNPIMENSWERVLSKFYM